MAAFVWLALPGSPARADLTDGLVGYWPFEGNIAGELVTLEVSGTDKIWDNQISVGDPFTLTEADLVNPNGITSILIDGGGDNDHALFKFPDLFGNGPGQIPLGTTILSANLKLWVTNQGDVPQAFRLIEDWDTTQVTWNSRMTGVPWTNVGADGNGSHTGGALALFQLSGVPVPSFQNMDILQFMQEWSDGASNFGFVIKDSGSDGIVFDTTEGLTPPVLTVTFNNTGTPGGPVNQISGIQGALDGDAGYVVPGKFGSEGQSPTHAGILDGTEDAFVLTHEAPLNPGAGSWSISMWFNGKGAVPEDYDLLFQKLDVPGGFTSWKDGFGCYFRPDGADATVGRWYIGSYTGSGQESLTASIPNADFGDWINFTMTYDSSTATIQSWVDGVAGTPFTDPGGVFAGPNAVGLVPGGDLILGERGDLNNSWNMTGRYDDVAVWSRALTTDEVRAVNGIGQPVIQGIVPAGPTLSLLVPRDPANYTLIEARDSPIGMMTSAFDDFGAGLDFGRLEFQVREVPGSFDTLVDRGTVVGTVNFIDVPMQNGNNDAEEDVGDGSMDLGSSDYELLRESDEQTIGWRWENLPIPNGGPIGSAFVQLQVDETKGPGPITVNIQGEAADTTLAFSSTAFDITSRPRTTAAVSWTIPAWPTVGPRGPDQKTPDLSSIITEIVSRAGWQPGNAITIIVDGAPGQGVRTAEAGPGDGAALEITPGGPGFFSFPATEFEVQLPSSAAFYAVRARHVATVDLGGGNFEDRLGAWSEEFGLRVINRGLVRILDEDFDDVPLRPVTDPSPNVTTFGGVPFWSPDFPPGWVSDRSFMPIDQFNPSQQIITNGEEYFGWTVIGSVSLWSASADGGQSRIDREGILINSFALSDSDINQTGTRAILTTPTVEIPANAAAFLSLVNDYRHFGDSIGDVDIVVNGGAPADLVDFTANSQGPISFPLPVSASTQTMSFIFDYRSTNADGGPDAGQFQNVNEWWWAFDQIKIEFEGDPLNSVRKSWEIYE